VKLRPLILTSLVFGLSFVAMRSAEFSPDKPMIIDLRIPDGLGRVSLSEQPKSITLQVTVDERKSSDRRPKVDVGKLGLQAWLLKGDGTIVAQFGGPFISTIGMGGGEATHVVFTFSKIPVSEIEGVVFRKEGKMYCRELLSLQKQKP